MFLSDISDISTNSVNLRYEIPNKLNLDKVANLKVIYELKKKDFVSAANRIYQ
jgi:hypothetical protein